MRLRRGELPHEIWARDHKVRVLTIHPLPRTERFDMVVAHGQTSEGTAAEFAARYGLPEAGRVLAGGAGRDYRYEGLDRAACCKRVFVLRERWAKEGFTQLGTALW